MPVTRGDGPSRRRLSTRRSLDPLPVPASKEAAKLQERRAMVGKPKRPTRWRGPKRNDDAFQAAWAKNMAPAVQSQAVKRPTPRQQQQPDYSAPKPPNIELRFSFTAAPDDPPSRRGRDETFTQSFSSLSMSNGATRSVSANPSQSKPPALQEPRRHSESISQAPQLAKPRKQREGYGFSYSETFMYDSDDYPDTECEWEPSEESQSPQLQVGSSSPPNPYLNWDGTERGQERRGASSRPTSRDSTTTIEDQSFNDLVVLRDVGSFHVARPQRILPCTRATREDTLRLKLRAKSLIEKFEESSEIQAQLLTRLERMMYAQQQHLHLHHQTHQKQQLQRQQERQQDSGSNPLSTCATKLRSFLLRIKQDRIDTGEHATIVQHEIEWVEWLVEASRTGVMHVRGEGCVCRPDWDPE